MPLKIKSFGISHFLSFFLFFLYVKATGYLLINLDDVEIIAKNIDKLKSFRKCIISLSNGSLFKRLRPFLSAASNPNFYCRHCTWKGENFYVPFIKPYLSHPYSGFIILPNKATEIQSSNCSFRRTSFCRPPFNYLPVFHG